MNRCIWVTDKINGFFLDGGGILGTNFGRSWATHIKSSLNESTFIRCKNKR